MAAPVTSHEMALALYYELRPAAIKEYNDYFLVRTPPKLQSDMDGILAPNQPKVMLSSGQLVPVRNQADTEVTGSPATATVNSPDDGYVKLSV